MKGYIKLEPTGGKPCFINVQHIIKIFILGEFDVNIVTDDGSYINVKKSPEEIFALIEEATICDKTKD